MITITAADLRDPAKSRQTYLDIEGPVQREDDGSCVCHPAPGNYWDRMRVPFTEIVEALAEDWNVPKNEVADHVRRFVAALPRKVISEHWHIKVWGEDPPASARCYELPQVTDFSRES